LSHPRVDRIQIRRAKTDALGAPTYDAVTRPEMANLIDILSSLTGQSVESICSNRDYANTLKFKDAIIAALVCSRLPCVIAS
jgi:hypothetical protein